LTHDHHAESDLGQVAVEALAPEVASLVRDDIVGLDVKLHGRVTEDNLERLELDGEGGPVTDSTVLGVGTRVEHSPSVVLTKTSVLSERGAAVGHVESTGGGLEGVLKTGTVSSNVDLDHVDGFGELVLRRVVGEQRVLCGKAMSRKGM